jgi:hypothetical protein
MDEDFFSKSASKYPNNVTKCGLYMDGSSELSRTSCKVDANCDGYGIEITSTNALNPPLNCTISLKDCLP